MATAAGLLLGVSLTACGTGDGSGQVLTGEGVQTLVAPPSEGGRDAEIAGELVVGAGGCLGVRTTEGREHILVWPAGTTLLTGDRTGVRVPDSGDIAVGESFAGGGGYASPPLGDGMPSVPAECAAGEEEVAIVDVVEDGPS